ncbi:MAG: queuosine precursor transporter [Candidatus Shapirobacteria bacterium]
MKNLTKLNNYKADLLIAIYIFCIVAAELMGAKTFPIINIFGFRLTGAVGMFLIPLVFSINDIFTEVFGFKRAKNLAKISIFIVFLIILFSSLAITLPPSARFLPMEPSYHQIFAQSIRISIASLIAIGISNFLDINVFFKLKNMMGKKGLWFRNNLSNILAVFFDTLIFMTVAFYSTKISVSANASFLWGIILPYWFLKTIMSVISTPFVYLGIKWLKKPVKNEDPKLQASA